jgi:hypothetical protein
MDELRRACAQVTQRARCVHVQTAAVATYAADLDLADEPAPETPRRPDALDARPREERAAFWLTMDAINFGSGWFPTLRKREGHSGYHTISAGLRDHFGAHGPWSPETLIELDAPTLAAVFGQDPDHELMALFAASLNDLGRHVAGEHESRFCAVVDAAGGSAVALARRLGSWASFADRSRYDELELAFLKRAQIAAADLDRATVAQFDDLDRLTMFADNLVPHVLRLDGLLTFAPQLVARIESGELIDHDSREEIEIRACSVHAVELIAAARPGARPTDIDQCLWRRGAGRFYKASPRHRTRCTAY